MAPAEVFQNGTKVDTKKNGESHLGILRGELATIVGKKKGFDLINSNGKRHLVVGDSISLDDGTFIKST